MGYFNGASDYEVNYLPLRAPVCRVHRRRSTGESPMWIT